MTYPSLSGELLRAAAFPPSALKGIVQILKLLTVSDHDFVLQVVDIIDDLRTAAYKEDVEAQAVCLTSGS